MSIQNFPQPARHAEQDMPLAECGFDPFEETTLRIARYFFQSFASPESRGWCAAFEMAEQSYPAPFGATIAMALARALEVLRNSRKTGFVYINPECPACAGTITQEERHLLSVLRAVRAGKRSEAQANAVMVCQGASHEELVASFERLCLIIGEGPLAKAAH
ncbi:MAG: hypothetical protein AAF401_09085 [Pseudomonadota bacterium]